MVDAALLPIDLPIPTISQKAILTSILLFFAAVLDEQEVIETVMKAAGVRVEDIPKEQHFTSPKDVKNSKRYYKKTGFAQFSCPKGDRKWPSAHAWCIIDLKEKSICYLYKQGCQKCETMAFPEFTKEFVKWVAELAVKSFLRKTGQLDDLASIGTDGPQGYGPHDEERCEMCQELGGSCWK